MLKETSAAVRLASLGHALRHGGDSLIVDRIHPRIATHAQATGRWSITDPPLQQMPTELLDMLVPDPGTAWFGWDWDQLHLRLAVGYAGDKKWEAAFDKGYDLHTMNACDLFGVPYPPDLKDPHTAPSCAPWRETYHWQGKEDKRRDVGKRYVYRLLKGGDPYKEPDSIPGIDALGLSKAQMKRLGSQWASQHPEIIRWMERLRKQVRDHKLVRDFRGRKRVFSDRRSHDERAGCDYPTQAGEVEILNETVLAVYKRFEGQITLKYQRHDFVQWAIPAALWSDDTVSTLAGIAEREWVLPYKAMRIPASYYVRRGPGEKLKWKRGTTLPLLEGA